MPASRARAYRQSGIEKSHRRLFLSIKQALALYEGRQHKELVSYERAFKRSLPKKGRVSSKQELLKTIAKARVVLVGDFHPFRQSQKGFLRLVQKCAPRLPRPVLALECIQRAHQPAVNEFLAGYITVDELREKIEFERFWPFAWEGYRDLLLCARQLKMPVLALNIPDRPHHRFMLAERDQAATELLLGELRSHPASQLFVLYGELHLARTHLPLGLRKKLPPKSTVVVVHQNDPDLYWHTRPLASGERPEVLRLGVTEFCIQNSLPWVKLRSYLDWLEGSAGDENWEEDADIADTIHQFAQQLAVALDLPAIRSDDLEFYGPERLATAKIPATLTKASMAERALCRHALAFQRTTYLRHSAALLIPNVNTNSLSEAASFLLWHSQISESSPPHQPQATDWMALFLVGYLGSKVLNPKRKCSELKDLKEILKAGHRSGKAAIAKRALALLRPYLKDQVPRASSPALRGAKEIEACRCAGAILGERLSSALVVQPTLLPLVHRWYRCASKDEARRLLSETATELSGFKPTHASKRDRF